MQSILRKGFYKKNVLLNREIAYVEVLEKFTFQ